MLVTTRLAVACGAAALVLQPTVASAQQACISEQEVSAIAIYSVPSLIQAVRLRCDGQLSATGYLARRGDALSGRYVALQARVWPQAKAGLIKVLASKGAGGGQNLDMIGRLPDNAVRPLLDALIVQEASPRIEPARCGSLERVIEAAAPIDPEIAGTLLGAALGLANPEQVAVCPARRV